MTFLLFACNQSSTSSEETSSEVKADKPNVPTNMHGLTPNYSASFVMDSPENTETVLALWSEWKDGDLSKSRVHFADTVAFYLPDGTSMVGATDSLLKIMQEYRNQYTSMGVQIDAIFSAKSTDRNENWVAVWGVEMPTDKQGRTDTTSLEENWRFNNEGKVNLMFQYARKGMIPPPPAQ